MNITKTCIFCNKEYIITKSYQKSTKFCNGSCAQLYRAEHHKKHHSEILLNNDNCSFYWIGFLLADGHFNTTGRLSLELSVKDIEHLIKFKQYIKCNLNIRVSTQSFYNKHNCILSINDTITTKLLSNKFNIKQRKTYNPPDISFYKNFTDEQLFSLIIGFIDGDGSITKQITPSNTIHYHITIENHKSWHSFYEMIETFLYKILDIKPNKPTYIRINTNDYVCLSFTKKEFIYKINQKQKELNLPVLERKWDKLDEIIPCK